MMTTIGNDIWRKEPPILRAAVRAAIDAWRTRRATQRPEELDDRMLRDIGMVRSEIGYGVRQYKTTEW